MTGTLKLDDTASFTGSVSGLTTTTYIDLADLAFVQGQTTATFSANSANPTSGGTLTVSDGTQSDTINLVGDYTESSWTLSQDGKGDTLVVDPPLGSAGNTPPSTESNTTPAPVAVLSRPDGPEDKLAALGVADIAFGPNTTLGYSAKAGGTGGTPSGSDGTQSGGASLSSASSAAAGFQVEGDHGAGAIATFTSPEASQSDPALITNPNHKP